MERIPIIGSEDELWFDEFFFDRETASKLLLELREGISWIQPKIRMFGKWVDQPRLMSWQAEEKLQYSYSGITLIAEPFSKEVAKIALKIKERTGYQFNSVLINFYRDGQDSMGWHADDEKELGRNPVIASVSFGVERSFHLQHNSIKEQKLKINLEHGSLLIMKGPTQHFWKHQIPKTAKPIGSRINLTFRIIK
jgi:alkylated DNA repair dioxygenase AlkB